MVKYKTISDKDFKLVVVAFLGVIFYTLLAGFVFLILLLSNIYWVFRIVFAIGIGIYFIIKINSFHKLLKK